MKYGLVLVVALLASTSCANAYYRPYGYHAYGGYHPDPHHPANGGHAGMYWHPRHFWHGAWWPAGWHSGHMYHDHYY